MSEKELNDILAELRGETTSSSIKEDIDTDDAMDIFSAQREEKPEIPDAPKDDKPNKKKKPNKKTAIIIALVVVLIIAIVTGTIFAVKAKNKEQAPEETTTTTTTKPAAKKEAGPTNPLTGEADYNQDAVGKRPVAVVVENEYSAESVRPQWAIDEADIVWEGESEYSTRMMMIWADATNMPEKIGPVRSARPTYINFSQLFDCIFIHAGMSHTVDGYVGANTVFEEKNIDHVNLLNYSENGKYFARDYSRTQKWVEHTGYLKGNNVPDLIKSKEFNADIDENKFSTFEFNQEAKELSDKKAENIEFVWSTSGCPKTGKYTYDSNEGNYTTKDFDSSYGESNVKWQNLIFLFDETEYITAHLKNGRTETYCDYNFAGGNGVVCSQGTAVDITWGVDNGKLWMKDLAGNSVKLNPGKSYIAHGSSNHGGKIEIQ